jgi:hypothetical protein
MGLFNFSELNTGTKDLEQGSRKAAESLYLAAGLSSLRPEDLRPNPWGDSGVHPAESGVAARNSADSALVHKVQDAARASLADSLNVSAWEKRLSGNLQDSIISGDTERFRSTFKELYDGLAIQAVPDKTEAARNDLRAIERNMKQSCGVDLTLDLTADNRVIVRIRPENLALEIGKGGDTVKRVEEVNGSVSLDNSKEVIRPTASDFTRSLSDRIIHGRSW